VNEHTGEQRSERGRAALQRLVWSGDLQSMPPARAAAIKLVRVASAVGADLAEGQLNLRAMSLVYTTLLSLVPLLAVSFSVLKGFGVHNQIEPLLLAVLEPLGDKGVEITERIVGFVDNIKVGVLGAVGVAMLFYVVVSLIQKIERAFNHTWRVSQPRKLISRFSDYFSVVVIGPVLVFTAMGITATVMGSSPARELMAIEPLGTIVKIGARLIPYLLIIAAFTFLYLFIPNTRVRLRFALVGALVAALLWQSVGWGFATFVVKSTNYTAIYSSFAILIVFMIWLYLSWLILLVGASVAFYYQNPEYLGYRGRDPTLSHEMTERVALLSAFLVAQSHFHGERAWTTRRLARRLGIPGNTLREVLRALVARGVLIRTGEQPPAYVPGRDIERLTVADVLDAVRTDDGERGARVPSLLSVPAVDQVLEDIDRGVRAAGESRSLRSLVVKSPIIEAVPFAEEDEQDAADEPESTLTGRGDERESVG